MCLLCCVVLDFSVYKNRLKFYRVLRIWELGLPVRPPLVRDGQQIRWLAEGVYWWWFPLYFPSISPDFLWFFQNILLFFLVIWIQIFVHIPWMVSNDDIFFVLFVWQYNSDRILFFLKCSFKLIFFLNCIKILEGTACYAGLLLAPADGFGLWQRHFWPSANSFLASFQGLELWMVHSWKVSQ